MPVRDIIRCFCVLLLLIGSLAGCGGTCKCSEPGAPGEGAGAADAGTEGSAGGDVVVAPGDPTVLVINEVDYDNPGSDAHEFVEIFNPGTEDVPLAGLALLLINGDSGTEYDRYALDATAAVLPAGGYLVIGSASLLATLPPGPLQITLGGSLQNGAPDGMALVDVARARVIDTLSYEGALVLALIPELGGPVTLVEAVATPVIDNNALGSLARTPNGQDTDVARDDWQYAPVPTPGVSN
jgi:hypothetical protein